jgi:hypothetical protein
MPIRPELAQPAGSWSGSCRRLIWTRPADMPGNDAVKKMNAPNFVSAF